MNLQALETHAHQRLCTHESAHAAAALVQGLRVKEVRAPAWTLEQLETGDPNGTAGEALIYRPDDDDLDAQRRLAICFLAGRLEEGDPHWPPRRLSFAPMSPDERDLLAACKRLGIEYDHAAYARLIQDTYTLVTSDAYTRAQSVIGELLERDGHVNAHQLHAIRTSIEEPMDINAEIERIEQREAARHKIIGTSSSDDMQSRVVKAIQRVERQARLDLERPNVQVKVIDCE